MPFPDRLTHVGLGLRPGKPKSKIQNPKCFAPFLAVCWLAGCAAQAPPRPPRLEVPQKVDDLAVHQTGQALEISFTLPALATDGEALTKPLEVELFRQINSPASRAGDSPWVAEKPWVALGPDEVTRLAHEDRVTYASRLSPPEFAHLAGMRLSFTVLTLTRGFRNRAIRSELSRPTDLRLMDTPGPVENLQTTSTEKGISLTWSVPARSLSGGAAAGLKLYRVYRSRAPQLDLFRKVGESVQPTFLDATSEFGKTYRYEVRALSAINGQEVEGEGSRTSEITPHDVFPPQTPAALTALYTSGAIELIWNASLETDLAGYNVYRREEGGTAQRVNQGLLSTPLYRDTAIQPGHKYYYRVTAVDLSQNESAGSEEAEADASQ